MHFQNLGRQYTNLWKKIMTLRINKQMKPVEGKKDKNAIMK
jgi:hypothetical protein